MKRQSAPRHWFILLAAVFFSTLAASHSLAEPAASPSEEVRALQRQLRGLGYVDTPDTGLMDVQTRYQIWFFAEENRLDKNGLFNNLQVATVADLLRQHAEQVAEDRKKARVVVPRSHPKDSFLEVVASPDGKWAASFADRLIKIWNLETGLAVRDIEFGCCMKAAAFLPDSKSLAIGTSGPSIRILDLATGAMTHRVVIEGKIDTLDRNITKIEVRPNSDELIVADQVGQVFVFDWKKNAEVSKLGRHPPAANMFGNDIEGLAVSMDGRLAASVRDDDLRIVIWDLVSRKQAKTVKLPKEFDGARFAFNSDATKLVVWSHYKNSMGELELSSGKFRSIALPGYLNGLLFNPALTKNYAVIVDQKGISQIGMLDPGTGSFEPDYPLSETGFASGNVEMAGGSDAGRSILAGSEGMVRIGSLKEKTSWKNRVDPRLKIDNVLPCGPGFSTIQYDRYSQKLGVWDFQKGTLAAQLRMDGQPLGSPDASGSDLSVSSAVCSGDGEMLITGLGSGDVVRWSLTGAEPSRLSTIAGRPTEAYDKMLGVAISPDKRLIAVSRGNGMVEPEGSPGTARKNRSEIVFYNAESGGAERTIAFDKLTTEQTWGQNQTRVVALSSRSNTGQMAFSPDGARLFAARSEWRFGMWSVDSGQRIQTYETLQKFQRFMPEVGVKTAEDRRVATHAERGFSRVQQLFVPPETSRIYALLDASDTGFSPRKTFLLDYSYGFSHPERVLEVETIRVGTIDRKGTRFFGVNGLSEILVYELPSGKLLHRMKTTQGGLSSIDVSHDGSRIYGGSDEGMVQTWDSATGELLATSVLLGDGEWLTMTPEGFFNGSPKAGQLIYLRTGPMQISTIDQLYQFLYRPDLVQEKLAGDPQGLVRAAAVKLDLGQLVASGAAPKVSIVSPAASGSVESERMTVEGEITDQGGGVGRIEWRINGVTQGEVEGQRGLARVEEATTSASAGRSIKAAQALSLEPGENTIELVAYNAANLIASEPVSIRLSLPESAVKTPPTLYVLAVGINDYYDGRLRLTYAVPDATKFSAALERAGAGHYNSIDVTTLTDSDVTSEGLERAFSELSKKVRPRDVLVFFAAGHGKTVDGRYYYLPRDFRYQTEASIAELGIGQDKWQAWFAKIPARKSILIYDTCESGTLTGANAQQIAMRSGLEQQAAVGRLIQATGRTVLTAATSDRPALEGYRGHGVFTYALLDGLARADSNGNGLIEVTELAGFVDTAVPEITEKAFGLRQLPQMSIQGSDFALARKVDGLVAESGAGPAVPAIPEKPTHVALEAVQVFKDAGPAGEAVLELKPGMTFAVIKTENGWSLIARDGKAIGYVEEAKAQKLQ